jgi:hypothetical protein
LLIQSATKRRYHCGVGGVFGTALYLCFLPWLQAVHRGKALSRYRRNLPGGRRHLRVTFLSPQPPAAAEREREVPRAGADRPTHALVQRVASCGWQAQKRADEQSWTDRQGPIDTQRSKSTHGRDSDMSVLSLLA